MAEIAVSVALAVVGQTSTIITDLIVKEGFRLSRLKEEISWVEREMGYIQSYLKDVEHNQRNSEGVANLIRDIRDLAFDVEDTMEKYLSIPPKKEGFKGFFKRIPHIFSDVYGARSILVEIESIKIRVEDINRVRQTYDITINRQHSDPGRVEKEGWDERRSFPHVDELNITGFENHINNLVAKIDDGDSKLRVISIIGMGGLGKTTLAKKIYYAVQHNFHLTAWVYVSENPNIEKILKDLGRQLVGFNTEGSDLEARMYEHLSVNQYVIVLDDVWHTKTWDALKIAIPTTSQNGSRIILSSRNTDVGIHVGGRSSIFELQPLSESNSKRLFETSIASTETPNDPPHLKEIGSKILYRCGGVPLAIVVMAGLLKVKERSVSAWNGVLEQMDQNQGDLSKTYLSSYKDLPSNLKPCFLYFGMFPEDYKINTFHMINLWAAEGFIKGSGVREVEDVGEDYLNHLIARNLIQIAEKDSNGKVISCRIHDILWSLCIQVAKDIIFSTDLTNYNGEPIRRVTTDGNRLREHISSIRQTPKLRSFLCFKDESWDSSVMTLLVDFYKELNLLRVLYLQVSINSPYLKEIWSLKNLAYLKLEISEYEENPHIPESIINLESLLTLDVEYWWDTEFGFPMVIWNMKCLRHLRLHLFQSINKGKVRFMRKGFKHNAIQFHNFRTLALPSGFIQTDWVHKFSKLRTLKIGNDYEEIVKQLLTSNLELNKLENLKIKSLNLVKLHVRTLTLFGYQNLSNLFLWRIDIEEWPQPDELPPNLTQIVLKFCNLKEDPLKVMEKIPKLRVLKLIFCCKLSRLKMVCSGEPGNFPQLQHFTIFGDSTELTFEEGGMPRLNLFDRSELTIEEGGMPRLKEFEINSRRYFRQLKIPTRLDAILIESYCENKRLPMEYTHLKGHNPEDCTKSMFPWSSGFHLD